MPEIRGDRSIRNIPIPPSHRRAPSAPTYEEDFTEPPRGRRRRPRRRLFWSILGLVVILCIIAGVLLSTVFEGAKVVVAQKTAQVTAPATMTASLNPAAGALGYQVVTTSRTASTSVPASGTQNVSRPASGVITIYNNYSTASQQLVINTRFETPDGKIYRIHQGVTVPGATKNADGSLSAGTVSVTAYADKPGADYNFSTATQFTIPGFKGDPRFNAFYAKADAMSGGLVGQEPAVASSTLSQAEGALKQGLQAALNNSTTTDVPPGFLYIPGTLQTTYDDVQETPNQDGSVTLSQTASATADVLRSGDLAGAIAAQVVSDYNGASVDFTDPSQLAISLASGSTPGQGNLTLSLSGTPTIVWQFDPGTLKAALVGKPKSQFQSILQSFAPAIDCTTNSPCSASIRPFWKSTFPTNPNKISVTAAPASPTQ